MIKPSTTNTAVFTTLKIIFLKKPVFVTENNDEIITARLSTITNAILTSGNITSPICISLLISPIISEIRLTSPYIGRHIDARGVKNSTSLTIRSGDATELARRIPKK